MAKFYGIIGYAVTKEQAPGVWVDEIIERPYTGDIIKASRRWQPNENLNANLTISETISIVADSFTLENLHSMKYVKWQGAAWNITSIEVNRPRLLLTVGGLYNGQTN